MSAAAPVWFSLPAAPSKPMKRMFPSGRYSIKHRLSLGRKLPREVELRDSTVLGRVRIQENALNDRKPGYWMQAAGRSSSGLENIEQPPCLRQDYLRRRWPAGALSPAKSRVAWRIEHRSRNGNRPIRRYATMKDGPRPEFIAPRAHPEQGAST